MTVPSIQCVKTDTDIYISAPASTLILQSFFFYLFLLDLVNFVYVFGGPYLPFINLMFRYIAPFFSRNLQHLC